MPVRVPSKNNPVVTVAKKAREASPLPRALTNALIPDPSEPSGDVSQYDALGPLEIPGHLAAQGATALISPLVSIYRNAAEREAAVEAFRTSLRDFSDSIGSSTVRNAWRSAGDWLSQKYPRVAAHMTHEPGPISMGPEGFENAMAAIHEPPVVPVDRPQVLSLYQLGADTIQKNPATAKFIMGHEATHVAQGLGNADSIDLYDLANQYVGYGQNPFETSANQAGARAIFGGSTPDEQRLASLMSVMMQDGINPMAAHQMTQSPEVAAVLPRVPRTVNAIRMLDSYTKQPRTQDPVRSFFSMFAPDPRQSIQQILKQRSGTPMKPYR